MVSKTNRAEISRSRSKKKPFKLRVLAENGEVLYAVILTTNINCRKNLLATMQAFSGERILVIDKCGKEPKKYTIHKDGYMEDHSK